MYKGRKDWALEDASRVPLTPAESRKQASTLKGKLYSAGFRYDPETNSMVHDLLPDEAARLTELIFKHPPHLASEQMIWKSLRSVMGGETELPAIKWGTVSSLQKAVEEFITTSEQRKATIQAEALKAEYTKYIADSNYKLRLTLSDDNSKLYLRHPEWNAYATPIDSKKDASRQVAGFNDQCNAFDALCEQVKNAGYEVVMPADRSGVIQFRPKESDLLVDGVSVQCNDKASGINTNLKSKIKQLSKVRLKVEARAPEPEPAHKAETVISVPAVPEPAIDETPPLGPMAMVNKTVDEAGAPVWIIDTAKSLFNQVGNMPQHPVVLVIDNSVLKHLATRSDVNDENSHLLGLVEYVSSLPNVVVVITSYVANNEARGIVEKWDPVNGSFSSDVINRMYSGQANNPDAQLHKHKKQNITEFLRHAYRVRINDGGGHDVIVPRDNPNPRLIVWETQRCRAFTKSNYTRHLVGRKSWGSNQGDDSITAFIHNEIPFADAPVMVMMEDNGYENQIQRKIKQTKHNQPVGYARLFNFLDAIEKANPDLREITKGAKTHLTSHYKSGMDLQPHAFIYKEYPGAYADGENAERLDDIICRGVFLANSKVEIESPLNGLIAAENARKQQSQKLPAFGLTMLSLMADRMHNNHPINYKELAVEINRLNKVDVAPKTPSITAEIVRNYHLGLECPDEDTHYALMAALVWNNNQLTSKEKQQKTEDMMEAWLRRNEMPPDATLQSHKDELFAYAAALDDVMDGNRAKAQNILNNQPRSPATADAPMLERMFTTTMKKDTKVILAAIKALESLSANPVSDEEKLLLFRAMIADNNGHAKSNGK